MIQISIEWMFYIPAMLVLLYLTLLKKWPQNGGYINLDGIEKLFFGLITIVFNAIWGGIFWW